MPHPMFSAMVREMEPIRAERMLDAAQAAMAQYHKANWWDGLIATARGVAVETVRRAAPLFTFNKTPINTSSGLRQAFNQHVTGGRVES